MKLNPSFQSQEWYKNKIKKNRYTPNFHKNNRKDPFVSYENIHSAKYRKFNRVATTFDLARLLLPHEPVGSNQGRSR